MTTTTDLSRISAPARVAEPGEGIGQDELATRSHGMPLEALRQDVTPPGLHYVLTLCDIPMVDPDTWRLEVTSAVRRPLTLSLPDRRGRSLSGIGSRSSPPGKGGPGCFPGR